jgi:hypothetical protein
VLFADWASLVMVLPSCSATTGIGRSRSLGCAPSVPALLLCAVLHICPESPKYTLTVSEFFASIFLFPLFQLLYSIGNVVDSGGGGGVVILLLLFSFGLYIN